MKTGEWNETFNFDEDTDLTTIYENTTDNIIMDSLSVAGKCSTSVLCLKRSISRAHANRK